MPGNIKVRILAGRGLPVMDRASETADAYVEVRFGQTTFKTDIFPKSLNPQWNSEWFKFEAEDEELQDEPLLLRYLFFGVNDNSYSSTVPCLSELWTTTLIQLTMLLVVSTSISILCCPETVLPS